MSVLPSENCAWIFDAPSTTWLLVTITPSDEITKPVPAAPPLSGPPSSTIATTAGTSARRIAAMSPAVVILFGAAHDHFASGDRASPSSRSSSRATNTPDGHERADEAAGETGEQRLAEARSRRSPIGRGAGSGCGGRDRLAGSAGAAGRGGSSNVTAHGRRVRRAWSSVTGPLRVVGGRIARLVLPMRNVGSRAGEFPAPGGVPAELA